MNNKELMQLAKKRVGRQKDLKNVSRMFFVTFVFLIVAVFMFLAVFIYLNVTVNKDKTALSLYIDKEMLDYTEYDKSDIVDSINSYSFCLTEDNNTFTIDDSISKRNIENRIAIVDTIGSENRIATKSWYDNNGVYLSGGDFYDSGFRQILLSESFCENYLLDVNSIVGKKISYSKKYEDLDSIIVVNSSGRSFLDIDSEPNNEMAINEFATECDCFKEKIEVNIFSNYEIVGVYSKEIEYLYKSNIIISSNSIKKENFPIVTATSNGYAFCLTYLNPDLETFSKEVVDEGFVFPMILGGGYTGIRNYDSTFDGIHEKSFIQMKNFDSVRKYYNDNEGAVFIDSRGDNTPTIQEYMTNSFSTYNSLYMEIHGFAIFFMIYGLVIFVASILNVINVLSYSKKSRLRCLSLNKAIGFTNDEAKKLYILEVLNIFIKAFILAVVVCAVVLLIALIALMKYVEYSQSTINLNWLFIFGIYALTVVFVGIIMLVIILILVALQLKDVEKAQIVNYER